MNTYYGNGAATSLIHGVTVSDNFGVGFLGGSQGNLVEKNKIGGNLNGVYFGTGGKNVGNVIRRNLIVGNPPVQVSASFGASIGADIQDINSAPDTNTFEGNFCLTYDGPLQIKPCPNVGKPQNEEDAEKEDMAAFGRNRLAFPQARLINAVFHLSGRPLPMAASSAQSGQAGESNSITVTGKVVDAACYMLHAPAATNASHRDCGAACLARGVPWAIAADDGALYFPADGNQRLKTLLNARVRAYGTVVEKHEPMELKMPVGDKNQMVVRMEGGYKQITIETLARIQAEKR